MEEEVEDAQEDERVVEEKELQCNLPSQKDEELDEFGLKDGKVLSRHELLSETESVLTVAGR